MSLALFNSLEALLWFTIAGILAGRVLFRSTPPDTWGIALVASLAFLLFGISDLIEVRTGAWWRPVWLLALKAACLITLLGCAWLYSRKSRPPDHQQDPPEQSEP